MCPPRSPGAVGPNPNARGFTLIEMMVVLALVALVSGVVALSIRPSPQQQLGREAERLALWLEAVRSQSRGLGQIMQVRVDASGAQILGPRSDTSPGARLSWLYDDTLPVAVVTLTLGPEPILPPQQLLLTSRTDGRTRVQVGTRGLGPWAAQ
jgi:general secretion pathway protein H